MVFVIAVLISRPSVSHQTIEELLSFSLETEVTEPIPVLGRNPIATGFQFCDQPTQLSFIQSLDRTTMSQSPRRSLREQVL